MDEHDRRSLADDPSFLASLADLDRGLDAGTRPARKPRVTPPGAAPDAARPHIPYPGRSPFEDIDDIFQPERVQPPPQRPQPRPQPIDLFPAEEEQRRPRQAAAVPAQERRGAGRTGASAPYLTFYGFTEDPFALSADPRFFYHSTPHDRVAQQLLTAIRNRDAVAVVTGELGAGKTTLCRTVLDQLDRRTLTSFVAGASLSASELLHAALVDFGVIAPDDGERETSTRGNLSTALQSFVESLAPLDASAVLVVDDAHALAPDVFEQIAQIVDAGSAERLQVVLVGEPRLLSTLKRPDRRPISERVSLRARLSPLAADEVGAYILHRLVTAGANPRVYFTESAIERVYHLSHGVPRVINLLCDRALRHAFEASAAAVDAPFVAAAAEDLGLGAAESPVSGVLTAMAAGLALALCLVLGAGVAAWVFRDAIGRAMVRWETVPPSPPPPVRPRPAAAGPVAPPESENPPLRG